MLWFSAEISRWISISMCSFSDKQEKQPQPLLQNVQMSKARQNSPLTWVPEATLPSQLVSSDVSTWHYIVLYRYSLRVQSKLPVSEHLRDNVR